MAQLAAQLASGFCGAGGWIAATGDLFNAGTSEGAAGYNANTGGFLAGIDKSVGEFGPTIGFAIGYDSTSLNERGSSGSASTGVVRLALYGAQQIQRLTLSGVLDYGSANGNVTRAAGIADFKSNDSANIFAGGLQASSAIDLGRITLTPAAGLRFASVSGGHFAEDNGPALAAYAVHGTGPGYVSTQPYAVLQLGQSLLTASGLDLGTHLRVGYQYEAGETGVRTDPVTEDGTILPSNRNHLAPGAAILGAAISAGKNNWSLYADYAAHVASNWNDQTGEFGVKVTF
jgi:outer membrane autotransporter protein